MKIEVTHLKAKLCAAALGFDDKVVVESARATTAFNDKLATELLDVAAHFDAKLAVELAAAFTAVDAKHASELASVFAKFEEQICAPQRENQEKLIAKIKEVQMYRKKCEK